MIYTFFNFTLDTDRKELHSNGKSIPLTKQNFDLLLYFVQNTGKVLSKDHIIEQVWQGRYVTENSIDQSISKLRKALNGVEKQSYIKTAYGKGFMFVPEVSVMDAKAVPNKKYSGPWIWTLLGVLVLTVTGFLINSQKPPALSDDQQALLMIINDDSVNTQDAWLNDASSTFVDQILGFANASNLKKYHNKPDHVDKQQYLQSQWQISPDLKVVTTHMTRDAETYTMTFSVMDRLKQHKEHTFRHQNLSMVMKTASTWLAKEVNRISAVEKVTPLVPDDSYLLELYMRGLSSSSKGEIDKAEHFFALCLQEKPDFYLARLQLANVKSKQGNISQSLSMLDTLSVIAIFPRIEIEMANIRADIYDTQGKYQQARDLYVSILDKYKGQKMAALNDLRYNLSYTYASMTEYDKALTELNKLESSIDERIDLDLLADVLQKKASILQKLGHTQLAKESAEKALVMYSRLDHLLGEAKVYSTLARITTHQSKYKESITHLEKAMSINKSLNYKLGYGANLNELIYVLMVRGEFSKAWQSTLDMQSIAIEIDYAAMLQIAKQYALDISRAQKKWQQAEQYLQEHYDFAQSSNNKRALLKNKLMALSLYLDQGKVDGIEALISTVQEHIEEKGEIRLQPRLDVFLARYYWLINKDQQALSLLMATKDLAKRTEDGESIMEINNLLAEHYLKNQQPQKAVDLLQESHTHKPLPYPYLLLLSKAHQQLGHSLKALDLANECKNTANEWWSLDDERYLSSVKNSMKL